MNSDRDPFGGFGNGLGGLGAGGSEQRRAGVGVSDNEYTAGFKVIQARANATETLYVSGGESSRAFWIAIAIGLFVVFPHVVIFVAVSRFAEVHLLDKQHDAN